MTGADGGTFPGWWHVREVNPPRGLRFELGDPGIPPLDVAVRLAPRAGGGTDDDDHHDLPDRRGDGPARR